LTEQRSARIEPPTLQGRWSFKAPYFPKTAKSADKGRFHAPTVDALPV
jgi:hypothetical protein